MTDLCMSLASTAVDRSYGSDATISNRDVIDTDHVVQSYLDVLDDPTCQAILAATSNDTLSANEISETCNLPLSTTYRKLDELTEAGLLDEGIRLRQSGKHASEYSRSIEDVLVSIQPNQGVVLHISYREQSEK